MIVLISGVSRGIGRSLVEHCCNSNEFSKVIGVTRNAAALEDLEALYENFKGISFDLQNGDFLELKEQLYKEVHQLDFVVNNAGAIVNKPFLDWSNDDFDKVYGVNIIGASKLLQVAIPLLEKSNEAHVLNISSMGGVQGSAKFPGLTGYSASKGALQILTECLAEEYKDQGISFNCISLGAVQTEMLQEAFPGYQAQVQPDDMARFIKNTLLSGHKIYNGKNLCASKSTP
jgi:NAD(P)-dependent dehydrogenase (short-subunit alcohol dehydrogenase family)